MAKKSKAKKQNHGIHVAAMELLKDPHFLFRVGEKVAEMGMVGERKICLTLLLASVTAHLEQPVSVLVKGPSSSGKNNALRKTIALLPPDHLISRSSVTPKALAHGSESLTGKVFYLFELVGGKDAQYMTRELQSEGALEHEHTVVAGSRKSTQIARRVGAPVFLTTTTKERVFADDETRFLSLRADESEELTRAVLRSKFGPAVKIQQPPLEVWHEAFRLLTTDPPKFQYPSWFAFVAEKIPAHQTRARRDADRFISLLKAVALCRSFSDGRQGNKKQGIEIDLVDYCEAYEILNEAFSFTYSGSHPMALQVAEAVRKIYTDTQKAVTVKQVADHYGWEMTVTYKRVDFAEQDKLIKPESGTQQKNLKLLLPTTGGNTRFLPHPLRVLRYGQTAAKAVRYVDPLTGQAETLLRVPDQDDEK